MAPKDEMTLALKETRALLQLARGELARNEANSRAQRKRLRQALRAGVSTALTNLMSSHQIVELWVMFLQYLLEVGGVRVDTYRFNTLLTYQSRVLEEVYRFGWDVDLLSLSDEALSEFYELVLSGMEGQVRADAWTVLQRFHECMQAWYGLPRCLFFPSIERPLRFSRSLVVPQRIACEAVAIAAKPNGRRTAEGGAAATQLVLQFSHGLRPIESHGLRHRDFIRSGAGPIRVQRNTTRSLKTLPRTIPMSLAGDEFRGDITVRFKQTIRRTHRDLNTSLFPNPKDLDALIDYPTVAAIASRAMKMATGVATAIPYNLRHSFATIVMSWMLMPKASSSLIAQAISVELALPEEALAEIAARYPSADIYPFQVDELGMWMGHRGHETVAVKYWHGAWWVIGEYCAQQSRDDDLCPAVFAALEGVDRAIITRRMAKTPKASSRRERLASTIRTAVEQSGLESIVPTGTTAATDDFGTMRPASATAVVASDLVLPLVDTILILRRRYSEEFDQVAIRCASDLALHVDQVKRFFMVYAEIGSSTEMFDFEPDDVRTGRDGLLGVDAGHVRRCELLARINDLAASDPELRDSTIAIVKAWQASVSGSQPRLVSRDLEALRAHLRWLTGLGYSLEQIEVACHAVPDLVWSQATEMKCKMVQASKPSSRTVRIGSRQEFAISVLDSRKLPNGRDFQRVMLGLAVWIEGGFGW